MENVFEIAKQWDITPNNAKEIKSNVWKIFTSQGNYALKRSRLSKERLDFIAKAQDHLDRCGFQQYARGIFLKGLPYLEYDGALYTLYDWVEGESCSFDDLAHLGASAEALGRFHLYARNETILKMDGAKASYFRWVEKLEKRIKDMERFQSMAASGERNFFDKMYLGFYEPLMAKARNAKSLLLTSSYPGVAQEAFAAGSFIHYDVAARNFVIQRNMAYLIDFDYCVMDIHLVDLMRMIKRSLKYGHHSEEKIDMIVNRYTEVHPLALRQWEVLYALLLFPQKYWRLAERYYSGDPTWSQETFDKKIRNVLGELENENQWLPILREKIGLEGRF